MDGVNCLICTLNPIGRADLDGLCVSCRAALGAGIYRAYWSHGRRLIEFATAAVHPLGVEYPHHADPVEYRPELLPAHWRAIDDAAAVLEAITYGG